MVPILSVTFTYRFEAPAIFVFIITPPSGAPADMSRVGVDCESGGRLGGKRHRPASRATAEVFASTRDGHAGLPALGALEAAAFYRGSEFSAAAARQLLCLTVRVYDTVF